MLEKSITQTLFATPIALLLMLGGTVPALAQPKDYLLEYQQMYWSPDFPTYRYVSVRKRDGQLKFDSYAQDQQGEPLSSLTVLVNPQDHRMASFYHRSKKGEWWDLRKPKTGFDINWMQIPNAVKQGTLKPVQTDMMLGYRCDVYERSLAPERTGRSRFWYSPELDLPLRVETFEPDGSIRSVTNAVRLFLEVKLSDKEFEAPQGYSMTEGAYEDSDPAAATTAP